MYSGPAGFSHMGSVKKVLPMIILILESIVIVDSISTHSPGPHVT